MIYRILSLFSYVLHASSIICQFKKQIYNLNNKKCTTSIKLCICEDFSCSYSSYMTIYLQSKQEVNLRLGIRASQHDNTLSVYKTDFMI